MIIEIIVIGVFSLIWISLLLIRVSVLDISHIHSLATSYSSLSPLILVIGMVVSYQLGWLINGFSYAITVIFFEKKIRDKIFDDENLKYEPVRASVYQKASSDLRSDLGTDRSVIRLSRAGAVNFFFISLTMLLFGGFISHLSFIPFLCFVGSGLQWYFRYKRYYKRMIASYKVIMYS